MMNDRDSGDHIYKQSRAQHPQKEKTHLVWATHSCGESEHLRK
jgi:hypothetical protein